MARTRTPIWTAISRVWAIETHSDKDNPYGRSGLQSSYSKDITMIHTDSRPDDTLLLESYHMSQMKKSTSRETQLSGKHLPLFLLLIHFLMDLLLQWVILRGYILELFYFSRSTFKALNFITLFVQFSCKNLYYLLQGWLETWFHSLFQLDVFFVS